MIKAIGTEGSLRTEFTNGKITSFSDTTPDKGGREEGFRPHELLEAALANCMNMAFRMFAVEFSIPLSSVKTVVSLNRSVPDEACFKYSVTFPEDVVEPTPDGCCQILSRTRNTFEDHYFS